MKRWVGIWMLGIALTLGMATSAFAIDVIEPPLRLSSSPLIISAYYINGATPGYFELYNAGSEQVDLQDYTLTIKWSTPPSGAPSLPLTMPLQTSHAYLPSHHYAVVGFGATVAGASISGEAITGATGSFVNEISLQSDSFKPYAKSFATAQTQRMVLGETSTGYTTTGSYGVDTRLTLYDNGIYLPNQTDFPLAPVEILANPRNCSPAEIDTACHEYVKFYNSTTEPVSFEGSRLRIGYQGQSASSSNTVSLGGTIQPGEYAVFDHTETGAPLSISNSGGYVWLEDQYGITVYPSSIVSYSDASSDTHKGQSWALLGENWQWALPSPAGANTALPQIQSNTPTTTDLTPCRADQYRSPETNRCRLIEAAATPTPCDAGEYRNPETGRCKKVATASSSGLQPCDEGQYRNPETNRCKSIASQTTSLTPCQPGWERNPDTNRCRKVSSSAVPQADFAVQNYQSGKQSGLGWIAFATVASGLVAYGIWEWRRELTAQYRRFVARYMR